MDKQTFIEKLTVLAEQDRKGHIIDPAINARDSVLVELIERELVLDQAWAAEFADHVVATLKPGGTLGSVRIDNGVIRPINDTASTDLIETSRTVIDYLRSSIPDDGVLAVVAASICTYHEVSTRMGATKH